jgi:hypothetical protein
VICSALSPKTALGESEAMDYGLQILQTPGSRFGSEKAAKDG